MPPQLDICSFDRSIHGWHNANLVWPWVLYRTCDVHRRKSDGIVPKCSFSRQMSQKSGDTLVATQPYCSETRATHIPWWQRKRYGINRVKIARKRGEDRYPLTPIRQLVEWAEEACYCQMGLSLGVHQPTLPSEVHKMLKPIWAGLRSPIASLVLHSKSSATGRVDVQEGRLPFICWTLPATKHENVKVVWRRLWATGKS